MYSAFMREMKIGSIDEAKSRLPFKTTYGWLVNYDWKDGAFTCIV